MTRTVLIADEVAAALGAEQVARLTGPEWAQRVHCWECDGWIETGEDTAVTLLRVDDAAEAGMSFIVHAHPDCQPSSIQELTTSQIQAHRAKLGASEQPSAADTSDVQVVATVFDTGANSGYPATLISYQADLLIDTGGGDRVDLLVSALVSAGWHLVTSLTIPPPAGPPGYRVRFTHEHAAAGSPGLLEVINPAGEVDTAATVTPARYWRPAVVRTGRTVLIQGSQYLTEWQLRGRTAVKAAMRAGLLVGGVVPVELRGPGNDVPDSVYR